MDANKLKKLHGIGYSIPKTCCFCNHAHFAHSMDVFGTCDKYQYKHLKHTGEMRDLSIYAFGMCANGFEPNDQVIAKLNTWKGFVK